MNRPTASLLLGMVATLGVSTAVEAQDAEPAEAPAPPIEAPPLRADQRGVAPDARRFLAPPTFAEWAGPERVFDGELSLGQPRPLARGGLAPALDDQPRTYASARGAQSRGPRHLSWTLLELGTLHEVEGGAVLATSFRLDQREARAEQGGLLLALPLGRRWLAPKVGLGAGSPVAPGVVAGAELRSDRTRAVGHSVGLEAASFTEERRRLVGQVAGLYRLGPRAALEERLSLGGWVGPGVGGEVALRWIHAGLQRLGDRVALYERATLARGVAAPAPGAREAASAWSFDAVLGTRVAVTRRYGVSVQAEAGAQPSRYERLGVAAGLDAELF